MATRITEVTRRDIRDLLSSLNLWGRLEEIEFLDRLYDLDDLPSHDRRFKTARDDIAQHRLLNSDWPEDWVLSDERFGLKDGDDEVLLRFLAELIHPVVRSDQEEVSSIAAALNQLLAPDGYRLQEVDQLSGRSVFAPLPIAPSGGFQRRLPKHFTDDVQPLVETVARLAELDGAELEREVLRSADPHLEEPEFDNWDGGTYYHTLTLNVPVDVFARLGDQVRPVEERIGTRIAGVLRAPDKHRVSAVVIQPSLTPHTAKAVADVVVAGSDRPVPHFWSPGQFRLFISHVTSFRQRAAALRQELSRYHISGFVAHETIDPGELWQREIEAALRSMHAMTALITPEFSKSNWTDQEVGWALGSGIYVLPVRRGADPYGFIGEVQGIQGVGKMVGDVAEEIFVTLLRVPATKGAMLEALVSGFERSDSYREARENVGLLERARDLPESLWRRIEVAVRTNPEVSGSHGVGDRVAKLRRR